MGKRTVRRSWILRPLSTPRWQRTISQSARRRLLVAAGAARIIELRGREQGVVEGVTRYVP